MLCQHCKSRQANTHIVKTVNGKTVEMYLCPECAKAEGFASDFSISDFLFGNMLSSPFTGTSPAAVCPVCHTSFYEISETGNVGCGECYKTFADRLSPTISHLHTLPLHKGKSPKRSGEKEAPAAAEKKPVSKLTKEQKIAKLKAEQEKMIKEENFEKAAELRDKIKKLEGGEKQ